MPSCPKRSVLLSGFPRVHKGDFNALDALDMDSEAVTKLSRNRALANTTSAAAAAFLGPNGQDEFGQEAPSTAVFEHRSGPPILPPHLLQVILNKVSVCRESTVLEELWRLDTFVKHMNPEPVWSENTSVVFEENDFGIRCRTLRYRASRPCCPSRTT